MEGQWYALRQALKSKNWVCEEVTNPFFRRLLVVLADLKCGTADQTKAYYDALASSHAFHVLSPSLPLVDPSLRLCLASAGLEINMLTGEVQLDKEELHFLDMDVYALQKRRYLIQPPMDPALLAKLPGGEFSTYNGRGQQTATRVALTSPDNATLFVNLPTGCGKTLLIHALMLMTPSHRLTLVIVPTVGLAMEQGQRVAKILTTVGAHHGESYVWVGGQNQMERTALRERLKSGNQRILFCAPEAARTSLLPILFELAKHDQLGAVIVDEAHLVDQWGAGFRPDFQLIPPLVQSLQNIAPHGIKTILMSATFSPTTLAILKSIFSMPDQEPIEVIANFLRPEPSYYLTRAQSSQEYQQLVLTQVRRMPRPLILYTTERGDAKEWYTLLVQQGYSRVGLFHGKTSNAIREQLITQWREDQLDIMVATSAFGVGMDKGNVRSVLHATVPENIDRYYQECGRGGRDGNASMAHLIYHHEQIDIAKRINQEHLITTGVGYDRWRYMHQSRESVSENRFRIDLRTQHGAIEYDSHRNMAWNWRTLLLMKRSGFIQLFFSEPQLHQEEIFDEEQLRALYNDFFSHVEVEIIHDGHLDQSVWDESIGAQRTLEQEGRNIAFTQLKQWLDKPTERPLCGLLAFFYTTNGFAPETACGGCPWCRSQGNPPYTPTLGGIVQQAKMSCQANEQNYIGEEFRVYYKEKGQDARVVLHRWKHLIALLLQRKTVRAIRAQQSVHEQFQILLPYVDFWCAISPYEPPSLWNELVLVMPDETEVPKAELCQIDKIFFIPDHLSDPRHPYRLWHEANTQAISFEDFERKLRHVDN